MRKTIFIMLLSLGFISMGFSQSQDILSSIGKKDLVKLESLMKDKLDFCINDGQRMVSKDFAIKTTLAFLQEIEVKSCRKIHNGNSKEKGTYYEVGKLKSGKGNYRVFIYYEDDQIVEFRIDNY